MPAFLPSAGAIVSDMIDKGTQGFDYVQAKKDQLQARELRERQQAIADGRESRAIDLHAGNLEAQDINNSAGKQAIKLKDLQETRTADMYGSKKKAVDLSNQQTAQQMSLAAAQEGRRVDLHGAAVEQADARTTAMNLSNDSAAMQNEKTLDELVQLRNTAPDRYAAAALNAATKSNDARMLFEMSVVDVETAVIAADTKQRKTIMENMAAKEAEVLQRLQSIKNSEEVSQQQVALADRSEEVLATVIKNGKPKDLAQGLQYMIDSPLYGIPDGDKLEFDAETGIVTVRDKKGDIVMDKMTQEPAEYDIADVFERIEAAKMQTLADEETAATREAAEVNEINSEAELNRARAASEGTSANGSNSGAEGLTVAQRRSAQTDVRKAAETQVKEHFGLSRNGSLDSGQRDLVNRAIELAQNDPEYLSGDPSVVMSRYINVAIKSKEYDATASGLKDHGINVSGSDLVMAAERRQMSVEELVKQLVRVKKEQRRNAE